MILIKNVQIVDGTGKPPYEADVLVSGARISAIGNFPKHPAEEVIDGQGSYLTPGFIDVNSSSDHYLTLFTEPLQHDFLLQGVTTMIGGNCGSSLAPLLYGSLESIRKWTDTNQINVDWHTIPEFFKVLERRRLGVNFGTLVGHSTIRRALIGETSRDLTVNELGIFRLILEEALRAGALGLSTGLAYAHGRNVPYAEIKELARVVARYGGVYAVHLRDEHWGIEAAVGETIKLCKETKVRTLVSHFRPILGFEEQFARALKLLETDASKLNLNFESYPFDTSLIPIYMALPEWIRTGNLEEMLSSLKRRELAERILKELPDFKAEDIIIVQAKDADYLLGKNLGEFARDHGLKAKPALLKLMIITKLRSAVLYRNINLDLALQSLIQEKAMVGSNSVSFPEHKTFRHEYLSQTFAKFLDFALETRLMPLEIAVRKITSSPAQKFGLAERGEIKEGNYADLTLINNRRITDVLVNGKRVVKEGVCQNILAGQIIRATRI